MEALQSWLSNHKLATIGTLWAAGIGASLAYTSGPKSPLKASLRLIHARMHAQALTLAVLSGGAAYHYLDNHRTTTASAAAADTDVAGHDWLGDICA